MLYYLIGFIGTFTLVCFLHKHNLITLDKDVGFGVYLYFSFIWPITLIPLMIFFALAERESKEEKIKRINKEYEELLQERFSNL